LKWEKEREMNTKDLTEFLDKYGVKYTIDGDTVQVGGDLYLYSNQLTSLPERFGSGWLGVESDSS
jgi:hypothetical protein